MIEKWINGMWLPVENDIEQTRIVNILTNNINMYDVFIGECPEGEVVLYRGTQSKLAPHNHYILNDASKLYALKEAFNQEIANVFKEQEDFENFFCKNFELFCFFSDTKMTEVSFMGKTLILYGEHELD